MGVNRFVLEPRAPAQQSARDSCRCGRPSVRSGALRLMPLASADSGTPITSGLRTYFGAVHLFVAGPGQSPRRPAVSGFGQA